VTQLQITVSVFRLNYAFRLIVEGLIWCVSGVSGRPFVKRFALCYRSVVCLSCPSVLSVTFVHCGQTVGRIKMKLGTQVGLGPGHTVSGGDPAPPPLKGPPIFGTYLLRPNGCIDQDVTWYGGRPRPRRLCVPKKNKFLLQPNGWMDEAGTWHGGIASAQATLCYMGTQPLPPKGGRAPSPIFGPFLLWPNDCMHQNATWYRARPRPRRLCVTWGPRSPPSKGHRSPIFGPYLLRPNGCMDQDVRWSVVMTE